MKPNSKLFRCAQKPKPKHQSMIPVFSASLNWTLIYTKSNAQNKASAMICRCTLGFHLRLRKARLAQILFWVSRSLLFAAWFCLDPMWHRLAVFFHQWRKSTRHGRTRTARRIQTVCVWLARSPYLSLPSSSFRWRRRGDRVVNSFLLLTKRLLVNWN